MKSSLSNFLTELWGMDWAGSAVFALGRCVDAMHHRERD
jgi:hypothetical protein